ncbi:MAG: DUF7660 family protein [Fimbriiglobus sp.]
MGQIDPLDPDSVHDRDSFLAFVHALIVDRQNAIEAEELNPTDPRTLGLVPDAGGWYNLTIDSFLEAGLRWADSTEMGEAQGLPKEPSWKAFAVFLLCGKIYE